MLYEHLNLILTTTLQSGPPVVSELYQFLPELPFLKSR